jgi:hypothetical protein
MTPNVADAVADALKDAFGTLNALKASFRACARHAGGTR